LKLRDHHFSELIELVLVPQPLGLKCLDRSPWVVQLGTAALDLDPPLPIEAVKDAVDLRIGDGGKLADLTGSELPRFN